MLLTITDMVNIAPLSHPLTKKNQGISAASKLNYSPSSSSRCTYIVGNASTINTDIVKQLSIEGLGWNLREVVETHQRLSSFSEDWNIAGMEIYDEM